MKTLPHLSQRGNTAFNTVLRPDFELYFEACQNIYDSESNPGGTFPLNVAENKLGWPKLREKLELISAERKIPDWVAGYTSGLGHETFRAAMAGFLSTFLTKCAIDPNHIGVAAGATSVIELSSWILADAGDVVVFPAPSYPVYKRDVNNKAGLERYDLITHNEVEEIFRGPILSTVHLDKAKKDIEQQGKKFKLLVLTNPDNPTGGVYTPDQLNAIADWCLKRKIHFVVNEIYAFSLIKTDYPAIRSDYHHQQDFSSFINIIQDRKSPYLHQWYALSKDLGISGLRVGMVYSLNEDFLRSFNNLSLPHMVSNHSQWLLENILLDTGFMKAFLEDQQVRLTQAYSVVVEKLRKLQIPYAASRGSLFIWADFSRLLTAQTQEAEDLFWENLYRHTGILLTPGIGFGHTKKGMFRIVYSCFDDVALQVAMARLEDYMAKV